MNDRELSLYRAGTIGFIFQFYNLLPSLTALENVSLVKNIVKDAGDAEEMLAQVGLAEHKNKFPAQMSGGEQQRVSIARALAKNPKIILGDEPTGFNDVRKILISCGDRRDRARTAAEALPGTEEDRNTCYS